MISLPLQVEDASLDALFPTATSAFRFVPGAGYQSATTLAPGQGYWINVPAATVRTITGTAPQSLPLELPQGWSMMGPLAAGLAADDLGASLISVFGYSHGYFDATTMEPGQGYWVNMSSAAALSLEGVPMGEVEVIVTIGD